MKKILVAVLMLFALGFAFISCGGGGGETTGSTHENSLSDPATARYIPDVDDSLKSVSVPIIPTTK